MNLAPILSGLGKSWALFIVIVAIAGLAGGAYAAWTSSLHVEGTIETGNVDVVWDMQEDREFVGILDPATGQVVNSPIPAGKDVAGCISDLQPNTTARTVKFEVTNAYPSYTCEITLGALVAGSVPVHISSIEREAVDAADNSVLDTELNVNVELTRKIEVDQDTFRCDLDQPVGINTQLHRGDRLCAIISIHATMAAQQNHNYTGSLWIDLIQWNFAGGTIPSNIAPTITSNGGGASANVDVVENQAAVTDIQSTDDAESEGSGLTYSLTGGTDRLLFTIDADTGVLSFAAPPDFENPADSNGDNVYIVQVTVTDADGLSDVQDLAVIVIDVAEQPARSIQGTNWNDLNSNGERDQGEPGLAGVTVYVDLNGNSALDNGEPSVLTMEDDSQTQADESGRYRIEDLEPGSWNVREVIPEGFVQTFPGDPLATLAFQLDQDLGLYTDGGNLFENFFGRGEKWLRAANRDDNWYFVTPTGDLFEWDNSAAATGTLTATLSPVYHADPALLYEAPVAFDWHPVTIPQGAGTLEGIDFGNVVPASASGRKWHDLNGDGIRGAGEPFLNGTTIELVNFGGSIVATAVTANRDMDGDGTIDPETESGWYWLERIPKGTFSLREVVPDGWIQTFLGDPLATLAFQLNQDLRLYVDGGNLFENFFGSGEKWLRAANRDDNWYFILPNRRIH